MITAFINDFLYRIRHHPAEYKKYRKEKRMTSAQLAEKIGLSHDFIRQIESEKVRYNFSLETFYKISEALGVGMDALAQKDATAHPNSFDNGSNEAE